MKTRLLFLTAAMAAALAGSAFAQPMLNRQANFDSRVDAGLRDRSITVNEAAQLRADFKALVNLETQYRASGGSISANEQAELNRRYDALVDRTGDDGRDDGRGGRGGDSLADRQDELDARIDAGVRDRSLTVAEAGQLRAEFQSLLGIERGYRASGGGLTQAERDDLDRRYDALAARIRSNRNDDDGRNASINQRQAELDARIDAGVRDRSLTAAEAAQLRADFQTLVRLEANYRASGGSVSQTERDDLNRRFDALGARIRDNRTDDDTRGQTPEERRQALNARIDAAARAGQLTTKEATDLRAESQAIARLDSQYRADGRFTTAERDELNRRYDALAARIGDSSRNNDARWANLNQRQAQFELRLDRAVDDGRISAREAQDLKAEFDGIARMEASYRRSAPGITPQERNDLNTRFDRLEERFRSVVNDGRYGGQYDNLWDYLLSLTR